MELLHDSELLDGDGEFLGSRFEREREIERRMEGEERCFEDIHRIDDDWKWNYTREAWRWRILFVLFEM